jgi:hypothetical protein
MNILSLKCNNFFKLANSIFDDKFLYHVTYYKNLSNISKNGLVPGSGQLLGHGGNKGRSIGKIFLTDKQGITHWYSKIADMAEYQSDNLLEDEVVPVVLRIIKSNDDIEDLSAEQAGLHNEYQRSEIIEPEDIEVFDGKNWIPIENYESIDIEQALTKEKADEDDLDKEFYYYFKYINQNKLVPS